MLVKFTFTFSFLSVGCCLSSQDCPKINLIKPCSCRWDPSRGLIVKCLKLVNWKSLKTSLKPFRHQPISSLLIQDIIDKISSTHLLFEHLIIDELTIENCRFRKNRLSLATFRHASVAYLSLTGLELTKVPTKALKFLSDLISLNLASNRITKINRMAFRHNSITMKSLGISRNLINIFPYKALRQLPKLEMLDLSHNEIPEIPPKAFVNNKNLIILQLSYNRLATISSGSLSVVSKLKFLGISENLLQGELVELQQLSNLESLELCNLNIDLRSFLPANLTLTSLVLKNSQLTNGFLLSKFTRLVELDLSNNRGLDENMNIFSNPNVTFNHVKRLDISESDLFPIRLRHFPNIQELYASWNIIPSLHSKLFQFNTDLRKLELKVCSIRRIKNFSFTHCPKLTNINLSYNELNNLPINAFANLKFLREIDLAHNLLRERPQTDLLQKPIFFYCRKSLERLSLANNEFQNVPQSLLRNLGKLKHLNLAGNHIASISDELQFNHNLNSLILRNNQLINVSSSAFSSLRHLNHLDISVNRLSCVSSLKLPTKLKVFKKRHNPTDNLTCAIKGSG